jgi:hypothetical protein
LRAVPVGQSRGGAVVTGHGRVYSTFLAPLLVVAQTPVRPLPSRLKSRFAEMRTGLLGRYRTDLDELRQFFRMGGMRNDAFR